MALALNLSAQGTAISYQGQLSSSGALANTNYDFRFAVYNAPTNGSAVSFTVTNFNVPVSNGLFNLTINFGANVFNGTTNGSNYWLDIGVRTEGVANFTGLIPRQPILPVPYSLFAVNASNLLGTLQSTQISGTVSAGQISGTYTNSVNFNNAGNSFTGTFSGTGSGLNNLNASLVTLGTLADARLSANVPLLDQNQVFTGSNSFAGPGFYSGVNIFTNNANSFVGNFFGNGLVGWISISATSTNAMRDAGYLMLNSGLSTVTLPATASLSVGDIVRVSGGGGGGWKVKENTSQSISGTFAAYRNCFPGTLPVTTLPSTSYDYHDVASSADGSRIYLVGNSLTGVYLTINNGLNWIQVSSNQLAGTWNSIACSANGKIVYAETTSGVVQKSTDGGQTWTATTTPATVTSISCSADGNTLFTGGISCSGNGTYLAKLASGSISYSANGGSTWTPTATQPSAGATVGCLAASSDCTRMIAGVSNGLLYASSDLGTTWTALSATSQIWSGAWMSADGSKFAATISKSGSINGSITYCSVIPQPNTSNTNNAIFGSQGSAVELQYIGNGQWIPVGSSGLLWSN